MNNLKNAPALLTPPAVTVHVVFAASLAMANATPYKYVTTDSVKVGDWVVVPVPPRAGCTLRSTVNLIQSHSAEYLGNPLLPDGKIPAMALVVCVDDCAKIDEDASLAYSWIVCSALPFQKYADLLTKNEEIVAVLTAAAKRKQTAEARAVAKSLRDEFLASLPPATLRKLDPLLGVQV